MANDYTYLGSELELFSDATVWKSYYRKRLLRYLGAEVLEVGAGLGRTTSLLCDGDHRRWVCLEPDPTLARQVEQAIRKGSLPSCCSTVVGTIDQIKSPPLFDTIVYIDVLEHIEDDRRELSRAADLVALGGHIVVLAPAHHWLYSSFDKVIGHHRRYSRRSLKALSPETLKLVRIEYLDCIGMIASMGNRLLLGQSMPTHRQIAVWDKGMVRLSRLLDPILGYRVGKSVLGIWKRI